MTVTYISRVERLKAFLKKHGVSQCGFARYLDVNPRTIRRWFSGKSILPDSAYNTIFLSDLGIGRMKFFAKQALAKEKNDDS